MLGDLAVSIGKEPYIELDARRPESYWQEFTLELLIDYLPNMIVIFGALVFTAQIILYAGYVSWTSLNLVPVGLYLVFSGVSYFFKVIYSYPRKQFLSLSVNALFKKVYVSAVRPLPCRVSGKIIGRGMVKFLQFDAFAVEDETGIVFLDYRQPLGIMNYLFGLLKSAEYQNQDAEIIGWYRRAPVPYIEIKKLKVKDKIHTCYIMQYKIALATASILLGLLILFFK